MSIATIKYMYRQQTLETGYFPAVCVANARVSSECWAAKSFGVRITDHRPRHRDTGRTSVGLPRP